MCGIMGYIGAKKASPILIEGLEKLEYRGYDSAGVAILDEGKIQVRKFKGKLSILKLDVEENPIEGNMGIGHTRWATHGEPSDVNSHPHKSSDGKIVVVHNGIIENYMEIKEELKSFGYKFLSDTDTEVIAHLLEYYYNGDILEAVKKAINKIEGAYGLGIIHADNPDMLIAVKKDSPLIVGIGEGENFIASDIPAVLKYTRKVYILENHEMAIVKKDSISLMKTDGTPITKEVFNVTWDVEAAEKGGYEHFMLKEIYEQPKAIRDTLLPRLSNGVDIKMDSINISKEYMKNLRRIYIVACGTAYHAGLIGKDILERYVRIPTIVDIASEFRYGYPFIDQNTLVIVVSQSGETADTLAALRLSKEKGARALAITNVVGSSIARESDDVLYTWAGPEIAVASTKAYTTQILALTLLALDMATKNESIAHEDKECIIENLTHLPSKVEEILSNVENINSIAEEIYRSQSMFYIGRGIDYDVAREGSLKLKEISYIHSEAIAAGELKHGTLALIEEGTPVIALVTQDRLYDKTLSNIKEVKARGAYVIAIAKEGNSEIQKSADKVIYIPDVIDEITPVPSIVPLQLLSYYVAYKRGCDIDKPKNLAKSVTVE
ncbi:glucosamine-fructose-6-phosphate aminotransferase (isomerizing) [Proteiniborus sp. DW1]|uniref:glutamine--fructose-6-phosphate transaminase (isomerizing) n=1 Tax=Proteiniborus sp. DW1 TaxID=1889883 RepID=UPI00092E1D0A|nr:glutamine--fructose-6-phosphate transaminase (isomerizing) [Proteiniborus sp. DW1]SCG84063.1 glucosamine-fructose-6-phosphate aminotransferase (isomerizing) [Proteiniborus sp. DW1]